MRSAVVLLFVAGCIDYEPRSDDPPIDGWPNPPAVEAGQMTDQIVQVTQPSVDILWVIDNSGSMGDEQQDLVESFPAFMDFFLGSGLDYHIGVTSTDLDRDYNGSQGKLVEQLGLIYLDVDTPDPITAYSALARLGTAGSGNEKGMGAGYLALEVERDAANDGFYRDESAVHTIVISDEPDSTPSSVITKDEFIDWYGGLKTETDARTYSSIIDPADGATYRDITTQIGGLVWDITSGDWPELLEELGVQAAGMKREYFLSQLPVPSTLEVVVVTREGVQHTFEQDEGYTYEPARNSIVFTEYIPPPLAEVLVTYEVLSSVSEPYDL